MELRFYIDPETGEPHIYKHDVEEQDVEDVLGDPLEDRARRDGARRPRPHAYRKVLAGGLRSGRGKEVGVRDHGVSGELQGGARVAPTARERVVTVSRFPPGWDEERVRRVLEHYEGQSEAEAVAEDEAAYESTTHTMMAVPVELVPAVRELIARHSAE